MNEYVHSVNSIECSCGWRREDDWKVATHGLPAEGS